jgi:hypothetical protein
MFIGPVLALIEGADSPRDVLSDATSRVHVPRRRFARRRTLALLLAGRAVYLVKLTR